MDTPRKKFSGPGKLLTIFAALFLLSAGLCGMQIAIMNSNGNVGNVVPVLFMGLGYAELFVMLVCILGIIITLIYWIVRSIVRSTRRSEP